MSQAPHHMPTSLCLVPPLLQSSGRTGTFMYIKVFVSVYFIERLQILSPTYLIQSILSLFSSLGVVFQLI